MKYLFLLFALFGACVFTQVSAAASTEASYQYEQPEKSAVYPDDVDAAVPAKTIDGIFETLFALAAFIPVAVQFLRKLIIPNAAGTGVQIFSWAVGIAVTLAGWLLNLGFLDGLSIWMALLYAAGASLAANGIFDTGLISALFGLFKLKTNS